MYSACHVSSSSSRRLCVGSVVNRLRVAAVTRAAVWRIDRRIAGLTSRCFLLQLAFSFLGAGRHVSRGCESDNRRSGFPFAECIALNCDRLVFFDVRWVDWIIHCTRGRNFITRGRGWKVGGGLLLFTYVVGRQERVSFKLEFVDGAMRWVCWKWTQDADGIIVRRWRGRFKRGRRRRLADREALMSPSSTEQVSCRRTHAHAAAARSGHTDIHWFSHLVSIWVTVQTTPDLLLIQYNLFCWIGIRSRVAELVCIVSSIAFSCVVTFCKMDTPAFRAIFKHVREKCCSSAAQNQKLKSQPKVMGKKTGFLLVCTH